MKNLSTETIEKMLVENFANDFAKMVVLNNDFYKNDSGKAMEKLITLKEDVSCNVIGMLLDRLDTEYWEKVEFIELTIGNLVEEKADEF